jgi:hypothetical protein
VDMDKASGTGKLLKAYMKDGKQFGEVLFKLDIPLKAIGKGPQQIKFADGAKANFELTLDACIDGTSEAGTMKMKMKMAGNATIAALPGSNATLDVTMEGLQTQKEPAKK